MTDTGKCPPSTINTLNEWPMHDPDCSINDSNLGPCSCGAEKHSGARLKSEAEKWLDAVRDGDVERLNIGGKIYVRENMQPPFLQVAERDANLVEALRQNCGNLKVFAAMLTEKNWQESKTKIGVQTIRLSRVIELIDETISRHNENHKPSFKPNRT